MTSVTLKFREGFDWRKVAWSRPDVQTPVICSYCSDALTDVPLMLFREDGAAVSFCDGCVATWLIPS